jgi:hypothetical protein
VKRILFLLSVSLLYPFLIAQGQKVAPSLPERTATVDLIQSLSFGAVTMAPGTTGGTVTVDYAGNRSVTGFLYPLEMGYSHEPAIFSFKLCPGRVVNVAYDSNVRLYNGSYYLDMTIGTIRIGNQYINNNNKQFVSNKGCDQTHYVEVGGTVSIKSLEANPAGEYTGSFSITFAQQ